MLSILKYRKISQNFVFFFSLYSGIMNDVYTVGALGDLISSIGKNKKTKTGKCLFEQ